MTLQLAIILIVAVAFLPCLILFGYFMRQVWKETDWIKDPGVLMVFGIAALLFGLYIGWTDGAFSTEDQFAAKGKTTISGTIEKVEEYYTKYNSYYAVKVDGKWYSVWVPEYSDDLEGREFFADIAEWMEDGTGQQAQLEVYSLDLLGTVFELEESWHFIRGDVYGITDAEGTVIVDGEAARRQEYRFSLEDIEVYYAILGGSLVLTAVGALLKFRKH